MTLTQDVKAAKLAELLKQVKAGNEIVLMQDQEPVAKLVALEPKKNGPKTAWKLHGISGHKVLTPNITHAELAEDMFDR